MGGLQDAFFILEYVPSPQERNVAYCIFKELWGLGSSFNNICLLFSNCACLKFVVASLRMPEFYQSLSINFTLTPVVFVREIVKLRIKKVLELSVIDFCFIFVLLHHFIVSKNVVLTEFHSAFYNIK